jgi:hypothetical protein
LEALMAELENEIQGGNTKPQEEKPKAKPKKKRKISVNVECDDKLVETKAVFKENLKPEVTEPVKKQSPGSFRDSESGRESRGGTRRKLSSPQIWSTGRHRPRQRCSRPVVGVSSARAAVSAVQSHGFRQRSVRGAARSV